MKQDISAQHNNSPAVEKVAGNGGSPNLAGLYMQYMHQFAAFAADKYHVGPEEAAGIFRESFIALFYNLSGGRLSGSPLSLRSYLFRIGVYKITSGSRRESPVSYTDLSVVMNGHYSEEAGWRERQELVYGIVCGMQEPCGRLLDLVYGENLSTQELAAAMNYANEQVAKNRKTLCVKKLRENIALTENTKTETDSVKIYGIKVEQYLGGAMSPPDAADFEAELEKDPALAKELDTGRHILEAFARKRERAAMQELRSIGSEKELRRMAGIGKRPAGDKSFLGKYSGHIIMMLLLVATGLLLYGYTPRYNSAALFERAMTIPAYEPVASEEGEEPNPDLDWLMELAGEMYSAEDYSGAIAIYDVIFSDFPPYEITGEVKFYCGLSHLLLGHYSKATPLLEISIQPDSGFSIDAEWYVALARLAAGERLRAREILEDIHLRGESPFADAAGELAGLIKTKRWF